MTVKQKDLAAIRFTFGTHKGKTLLDVYQCDPEYLNYIERNFKDNQWIKQQVIEFLNQKMSADQKQDTTASN